MPLQFDNLILSRRQPVLANDDPADPSERFFWSDGLELLDAANDMLQRLPKLGAAARANFWQGQVPAELLKFLPARLKAVSAERIIKHARAWESQRNTVIKLSIQARGERLSPKSDPAAGEFVVAAKSYALHLARCWKTVKARSMPEILARAVEQDDIAFFKRLGRALAEKKPALEVDWSEVKNVHRFLVGNWCRPSDYAHSLPALCFFTDQALADFCAAAFGENPGDPSSEVVRQWRRRLGLKPVRWPKVRQVTIRNGEIMFA
jgi:hypothetical protein